ncbi:MAG TPA: carboxypeptidase-like regulatory domain-containing protein [Anaeromyxobacteraceae bacterium]|nr:carboxypeptidase-like regulatory domain-containing protein [Anaeromyxobacteraceae bacterium]
MKRWQLLVIAALVVLAVILLVTRRRGPAPEPRAGAPSTAPAPPPAPTPPPVPEPERPAASAKAVPAAPARRAPAAPPKVAKAPAAPGSRPTRRPAPPGGAPGLAGAPAAGAAAAQARGPEAAVGWVLGRVRSPEGSPVTRFTLNGRPVSDPDGAFRVDAPRGGTVRIAIRADGYATALQRARQVRGEVVLPDVVLEPGVAVVAEIVDAATQALVPEARAALADAEDVEEAWQSGEPLTRIVEPAAAGRGGMLLLERVPRGEWLLLVHHRDYRLELTQFRHQDQATRVALHRGGSISGRVVGSAGRPLGGARVVAISRSALDATDGRTDADGRFRLGPLHPGRYAVLAASPDRAQPLGSIPVEVRDGEVAAADFRARSRGATVRVRVLGARGEAASALLAPGEPPKPASLSALLESTSVYPASGRGSPQVIPSVPAGRHTLFVLGDSGELAWRKTVDVPANGELKVEVRLPGGMAMSLPW